MLKWITIVILYIFITCLARSQNRYADSIKAVLAKTSQPLDQFGLLNKLVDNTFTQGAGNIDYSSCLEMVSLAQQLNSDSLLAIAYNTAGNYFLLNNGDYSNALEYFFKGIPRAEKARDKRRLSSLYIDIAIVYYRLNNADELFKYLQLAKSNLPDTASPLFYFMLVQLQAYTCRYYLMENNTDSALYYVTALNEANQHLKSPVYGCAAENMMGIIFEKNGDTATAEQHYRNAIHCADTVSYFYIKLTVKLPYIEYLIKVHKIAAALEQTRILMNMGMEKNNADVKKMAAGFFSKIAAYQNRMDSAYYYSQMESALKDAVLSQNNLNKIQSLVFGEQLRVMEEEARKAAEEERRKQNIQYVSIALGIITFLILFLLISQTIIIHTGFIRFLIIVALLIVFEFLNLVLHPFLERITHHNAFLMLMSLVGIAALLVPLHHRLEKRAIHALVEKNKRLKERAVRKTAGQLEQAE